MTNQPTPKSTTAQAQDEWEQITVPETVTYSKDMVCHYEFPAIRRKSDGFTLVPREERRDMEEVFFCYAQAGFFCFLASRWNLDLSSHQERYIPRNYYVVYVDSNPRSREYDSQKNKELLVMNVKNIEGALKNLPEKIVSQKKLMPVQKVLFDISGYREPRRLVVAEEVMTSVAAAVQLSQGV